MMAVIRKNRTIALLVLAIATSAFYAWFTAPRVIDTSVLNLNGEVSLHGLRLGSPLSEVEGTLARADRSEFPWWAGSGSSAITFLEQNSSLTTITGYCVKQDGHRLLSGESKETLLRRLGQPDSISSYRGEEIWIYHVTGGYLEVYWDYYLLSTEPRVAMYYSLTTGSVHTVGRTPVETGNSSKAEGSNR